MLCNFSSVRTAHRLAFTGLVQTQQRWGILLELIQNRLNDLWQMLVLPAWSWFTSLEWPVLFASLVLTCVI